MENALTLTTERLADLVLLLPVMLQVPLPALLDRHLPSHWLQQGLSWGWVTTIWLAHSLSQGDHRTLTVRDWVAQPHATLQRGTGQRLRATDCTDDRLTLVLRELSKPDYWHASEHDFAQNAVRVYELPQNVCVWMPPPSPATTPEGKKASSPSGIAKTTRLSGRSRS